MPDPTIKKGTETPTIDVCMVVVTTTSEAIAIQTSTEVAVEPQISSEDAIKLIVKGKLISQKPATNTLTGHQITLTDNVFNAELVRILQGGEIKYDAVDTTKVIGYTPPISGSGDSGEVFKLDLYSAIYNAAGIITGYEKVAYPNCQGSPVALNVKDGEFRAPEYTINSAPSEGQAPYDLDYVTALPVIPTPPAG